MNEIARNFGRNFAHLFIVIGLLVVVMSFGIMDNNKQSVNRPPVKESVSYLIQFCAAPEDGAYPTKALVRDTGAGARYVTSKREIHKALEDALGGKDWKGVTVVSFCK